MFYAPLCGALAELLALHDDVGALLLAGLFGLFFRRSCNRSKARQIVTGLVAT